MNPADVTQRRFGADTHVLTTHASLPGLGLLPVQTFVILSREPVLVDTGPAFAQDGLLDAIGRVLDPADLRWIWLTHCDADHVGNLHRVLELAPQATVLTDYLGVGKLGLLGFPLERLRLRMLAAGDTVDVGDRKLAALRVPAYDAPETMGLFDGRSRHLFSSDCFGALLDAPADDAEQVAEDRLREGQQTWATVDSPWLHAVPRASVEASLRTLAELDPAALLSSHLPPARGAMGRLFEGLAGAGARPRFVAPVPPQPAPVAEVMAG